MKVTQGREAGELPVEELLQLVVLQVQHLQLCEAVEGLVAHGLDAGGVQEEAGDALATDEGLD